METPARSLKRLVDCKPVKCDTLGDHWLHPIRIIDQMCLDGALREIYSAVSERIQGQNFRDQVMSQGLSIGTVQLALRLSDVADSELVFPSFADAYASLVSKPSEVISIYGAYVAAFDLSQEEKKI